MKTQIFLILLFFVTTDGFSQQKKSNHDYTNVHHYGSNITLKNFDGSHSSIYISGNSATLFNSNGAQSTIDFFGRGSNLIAIDGTSSSITHNGLSSTVHNSDGTRILINHSQSTSSCHTSKGKHTISHTFGDVTEMRRKKEIDVLIHMNWVIMQKVEEAMAQAESNEQQIKTPKEDN